MLLRNAGRVMTRGQLIDRIWGADYVGDTKTLDVHVKRLRGKIESRPRQPDPAADRARAGLQVRRLSASPSPYGVAVGVGAVPRSVVLVGRVCVGLAVASLLGAGETVA